VKVVEDIRMDKSSRIALIELYQTTNRFIGVVEKCETIGNVLLLLLCGEKQGSTWS